MLNEIQMCALPVFVSRKCWDIIRKLNGIHKYALTVFVLLS